MLFEKCVCVRNGKITVSPTSVAAIATATMPKSAIVAESSIVATSTISSSITVPATANTHNLVEEIKILVEMRNGGKKGK